MGNVNKAIAQLLRTLAAFVEQNAGLTPDLLSACMEDLREIIAADPEAAKAVLTMAAAALDATMSAKEGQTVSTQKTRK